MPEQNNQDSIKLKCENPWFSDVYSGRKNFEVRVDDRGYEVGKNVTLLEYDRASDTYLGRSVHVRITYILRDNRFVPEGKCIFGFVNIDDDILGIKVTTSLQPEIFKFIADMAQTNKVSVPDLIRNIVEEKVGNVRFSFHYNERERTHP